MFLLLVAENLVLPLSCLTYVLLCRVSLVRTVFLSCWEVLLDTHLSSLGRILICNYFKSSKLI